MARIATTPMTSVWMMAVDFDTEFIEERFIRNFEYFLRKAHIDDFDLVAAFFIIASIAELTSVLSCFISSSVRGRIAAAVAGSIGAVDQHGDREFIDACRLRSRLVLHGLEIS